MCILVKDYLICRKAKKVLCINPASINTYTYVKMKGVDLRVLNLVLITSRTGLAEASLSLTMVPKQLQPGPPFA